MSVPLVAKGDAGELDGMQKSTFGQRRKLEIKLTSGPGILSANVQILSAETEGEEIEVDVKDYAGGCADGGLRECEV